MGGALNLDLPFVETDPAVLDAYLEDIDRKLDDLFLDAVRGEVERLRLERHGEDGPAASVSRPPPRGTPAPRTRAPRRRRPRPT